MKAEIKKLIILIINVFISVSTVIITIAGVTAGAGEGQVGESMIGAGYFKAFTIDSNVLMGIIALIYTVFFIRELLYKKEIPYFINVIYLMGATAVSLTFLTVVFFLSPMRGLAGGIEASYMFFTGDMFFFHFLNPILSAVCFLLMDGSTVFGIKANLIGIIPTVIYSLVYAACVAFFKIWSDFYGFTFGGHFYLAPLVMAVMYSVSFLIAFVLIKLKKKITDSHA